MPSLLHGWTTRSSRVEKEKSSLRVFQMVPFLCFGYQVVGVLLWGTLHNSVAHVFSPSAACFILNQFFSKISLETGCRGKGTHPCERSWACSSRFHHCFPTSITLWPQFFPWGFIYSKHSELWCLWELERCNAHAAETNENGWGRESALPTEFLVPGRAGRIVLNTTSVWKNCHFV